MNKVLLHNFGYGKGVKNVSKLKITNIKDFYFYLNNLVLNIFNAKVFNNVITFNNEFSIEIVINKI